MQAAGDSISLTGIFIFAGLVLLVILMGWIIRLLRGQQAGAADREEALREKEELQRRFDELQAAARSIEGLQKQFEGRLAQLSEHQSRERAEFTRSMNERLDGVSKRMNDSLKETSEKTAGSLGLLTKHLEVIDKAQQNISDLAGQVIGLQDILDNKQARGAFGEIQLQDLVSSILPPSAYDFQASLGNGKRADCLIRLPNPPGPICIDSKFPLESYYALKAGGDDAAVKRAEKDFRTAIQKHVTDIRDKYILPGETAESALMFLPSEAVYAELHASFPDAVEQSYRAKVWIVSPTTLMATLNTVRAILKDARMREEAHKMQAEIEKLLVDVRRLDKRVDNLRRHFAQGEDDLRQISTSTEKILRRGEKIEEVQLGDDENVEEALASGTPPPAANLE